MARSGARLPRAGPGSPSSGVLNSVAGLFLVQIVGSSNLALAGLLVALCFASIAGGQLAGQFVPPRARLAADVRRDWCWPPRCRRSASRSGNVSLLLAGSVVVGLGIGLALGHGLASINADCPPARRGETNSTFFAVLYAGLCLPVIGAGAMVNAFGLRAGGEIFSAVVAAVAIVVGVSLLLPPRVRTGPNAVSGLRPRPERAAAGNP